MPSAQRLRAVIAALSISASAACGTMQSIGRAVGDALEETGRAPGRVDGPLPRTRADRSGYTETSTYDDVVEFLDALQRAGVPLHAGSLGQSPEGRAIPYVIASRPLVASAAEARRLGRPVVYVQANIHAGEVEGKEALLEVIRDLGASRALGALDSLVLIAVPIYNADGNERLGPQQRNRPEQNGPARVGERANGAGLDLNRDYVKTEAPETRGALALFRAWDPDVFVDLHTTNGSYHGYALTYAPSLHPSAGFGGAYARDSLLPELRRRMRARHGLETFDYGNFSATYGEETVTDTVQRGWWTYDHRARYGTNYYGLRGRVAILSEAYSHDPFERRIRATGAFVREILSLVAARGPQIRSGIAAHDAALARATPRTIALRADYTRAPAIVDVRTEDVERTGDSAVTEAGVPPGLRRTGRFRVQRLPVHDRFEATLERPLPPAYAIPGTAAGKLLLDRLRAHGIIVERLSADWPTEVERFTVTGIERAARPFQGHREVRLDGRWSRARATLPDGAWVITTGQPAGMLVAALLEPESDDGLATWNALDDLLLVGEPFPVWRVMRPLRGARRIVD